MANLSLSGQGLRQTASISAHHGDTAQDIPDPSALGRSGIDHASAAGLPVLLTKEQAAERLGVSKGLFETLREEPWMPRPVIMGQRVLRWIRSELDQAIVSLPRQAAPERQPPQLAAGRRAKIERMKARGVPA